MLARLALHTLIVVANIDADNVIGERIALEGVGDGEVRRSRSIRVMTGIELAAKGNRHQRFAQGGRAKLELQRRKLHAGGDREIDPASRAGARVGASGEAHIGWHNRVRPRHQQASIIIIRDLNGAGSRIADMHIQAYHSLPQMDVVVSKRGRVLRVDNGELQPGIGGGASDIERRNGSRRARRVDQRDKPFEPAEGHRTHDHQNNHTHQK